MSLKKPSLKPSSRLLAFRLSGVLFLGIALLSSVMPGIAFAKPDKNAAQEVLKAKAATWRETQPNVENPTSLHFTEVFPDREWWLQFKDPQLTAYIQEAVKANLNLSLAHERIQESRAIAQQTLGRELPQVSLGGTFNRQRSSATTIRSVRPTTTGGTANTNNNVTTSPASNGGGASAFLGRTLNFISFPLNVNYEADIWHKNRDRTQAANRQTDATLRDFQAVHVSLATDVANAYFALLTADRLLALQNRVIDTAELDLKQAQLRFAAGLTDNEDVVLRQGRLSDYKAQLQGYYRQQALALHQLAILLGKTPAQVAELERTSWEQYTLPSEITAGLPSDLLARRPDILAEEDRLAASGLLVQVARKEFLPSFNLVGQFGFSSARLQDVFRWDSHVMSLGSNVLQSLFTGGQTHANLRVFKSRYEQQLLTYRATILQAFREVDDALASLKANRNAYASYAESLGALQQRRKIQENRLAAGAVSGFDLNPIRLEETLAEENIAQAKLATLTDTLSLYKALGGGY